MHLINGCTELLGPRTRQLVHDTAPARNDQTDDPGAQRTKPKGPGKPDGRPSRSGPRTNDHNVNMTHGSEARPKAQMQIHTTRNTKFPGAVTTGAHMPATAVHRRRPHVPKPQVQAHRAHPISPSSRTKHAADSRTPRVQPWHRLRRPGQAAAAH